VGLGLSFKGKLSETIRIKNKETLRALCPAPDCCKEFAFYRGEKQVSELPIHLLERRHFYRSDLGVSLTSFL